MFSSLAEAQAAAQAANTQRAFAAASAEIADAVKPYTEQLAELRAQKKQYDELTALLHDMPKTLTKPVMVPLGTQAFVPGELYRTNARQNSAEHLVHTESAVLYSYGLDAHLSLNAPRSDAAIP